MVEIKETAITWDHDLGTIVISTRSKRLANKLRKMGLTAEGGEDGDYATFRTNEAFLRVGVSKRPSTKRTPPWLKNRTQIGTSPQAGGEMTPQP